MKEPGTEKKPGNFSPCFLLHTHFHVIIWQSRILVRDYCHPNISGLEFVPPGFITKNFIYIFMKLSPGAESIGIKIVGGD